MKNDNNKNYMIDKELDETEEKLEKEVAEGVTNEEYLYMFRMMREKGVFYN